MNKTLIIFAILALTTVLAVDENCKDHPWAKRNVFGRLRKALEADEDDTLAPIFETFSKDSTALASTDLDATVQEHVPAGWITSDVKTCCTQEVYDALLLVPEKFVDYVSSNPSMIERVLAGLPKGLKKCGAKKPKGPDGKEVNPEELSVVEMMRRVFIRGPRDGEEDGEMGHDGEDGEMGPQMAAGELLKKFYIAKAKIVKAWVQYQRGALMFFCRLPSNAQAGLKGSDEQLAVKKEAFDKLKEEFMENLKEITGAMKGFSDFMKVAFEKFGGEKCQEAGKKLNEKLQKIKPCPEGQCDQIKPPKPMNFNMLKFLIGKPGAAGNADFEGTNPFHNANGEKPPKNLRGLVEETDEADPISVENNDADGVSEIAVASDDNITAGGPYKADGTCEEAGCNDSFKPVPESERFYEGQDDVEGSESGNSVLLTFGFAILALLVL